MLALPTGFPPPLEACMGKPRERRDVLDGSSLMDRRDDVGVQVDRCGFYNLAYLVRQQASRVW